MIGEKIDLEKISERSFDPKELLTNLREHAFWKMASWGATAFVVSKDKFARFMVSGHHHRGHIYIALAWNDTFTVYLTTPKGKVVDILESVYIDELVDRIDKRIEYVKEYKNN